MMDKIYNSDESDDGDIFSNQNQTQIQSIRMQGPNISNYSISKLPIGNHGRPRYAESFYDQRSYLRERRDTSPMSVHSTMSMHHQKFQHSMFRGATSSQRSMYNGGFGSSMSVRSFDSNVTLSAIDIAQAFKNENFNERDKRIIEAAFNKYMKKRSLKRIKKRRKKRLISYDSGEQGGESSGSSDDARSVRTCRTTFPDNNSNSSCKSARTDCTAFRRTIQRADLYNDCTENLKQNAFRSLISAAPKYGQQKVNQQKSGTVLKRTQHYPLMSQKERFGSGFRLPAQKFYQSTASIIPEHQHEQNIVEHCTRERDRLNHVGNHQLESSSENEEIFSANTTVENNITKQNSFQSKRNFNHSDDENNCLPQKKRNKLSSPQKRIDNKRSKKQIEPKTDSKTCDFIFARPQLPLRKPVKIQKPLKPIHSNKNTKQNNESSQAVKKTVTQSIQIQVKESIVKPANAIEEKAISQPNPSTNITISSEPQPAEQLIAMSSQPLDDVIVSDPKQMLINVPRKSPQVKNHIDQSECTQLSITDMSMRPSFIKRKLFTQKADIADNKNASSDSLEENSSQSNVYSMIQKEKNRTRKLVTSQSCLNRDLGDESNLLDLIHKIVPANQMNITSATNRTDIRSNKSKPENGPGDKWDVSLAITKCNKDEESDTYTDEEIFNTNETVKSKATNTNTARTEKEKPNKITNKLKPPITQVNPPEEKPKPHKSKVSNCVKSFWSSDEENDGRKVKIPEKTKTNIPTINKSKLNQVSHTAEIVKEKPKQVENKLKHPIAHVKPPEENQDIHKNRALKCINSFWHSDVESDEETAKNSETTITNIKKKNDHKLDLVSSTEELSTKNKTCMNDAEKHTKTKNGESKTITSRASRNSKQNKLSKDKSLSKYPPQKEQMQSTKTKQLGKFQQSVSKEIIVKDTAVKKTQEKVKPNKKEMTSVNNEELNNTKLANGNRKAAMTYEKHIYKKVINNTLRIRCPKQKCCDESAKNAVNDTTKALSKSLRNRDVDLSTTASSGLDTTLKDVPKRRGRPRKIERSTKTVENKENVSNLSDLSFTLQLDRTIMTRRMKSKLCVLSNKDNRKRPSDVSFSLVTDCKNNNNNKTGVTTRSADKSRNEINSNSSVVEVTKQKRMPIKSPLKITSKAKCRSK